MCKPYHDGIIVQEIIAKRRMRKLDLQWVKVHAGTYGKELADKNTKESTTWTILKTW